MNKQTDGLLEQILNPNNMNLAYKRIKSNKGSGGVDEMSMDTLLPYLRNKCTWRAYLMLNSILTNKVIDSFGYMSVTSYYLKVRETKEAPYNELYVRWCERSAN